MTLPSSADLTLGLRPLPALVSDLRREGVRFNAYAERLLQEPRVEVARDTVVVHVEVHNVRELGWSKGAPLEQVLRDVADRGLAPCPLETALVLRLAWRATPVSPRITVASARIDPDEAVPRGFYLRDDADGCWLRAFVASEDWVFAPEERLALLRRRPR
jgi:hypothetical protein